MGELVPVEPSEGRPLMESWCYTCHAWWPEGSGHYNTRNWLRERRARRVRLTNQPDGSQ